MAYSISKKCIQCDSCIVDCPVGAISIVDEQYWIDPTKCNDCEGYYDSPLCLISCPVDSPVPLQAKKGRYKNQERPALSFELFPNGKNNSFASAIVMWELCNLLSQRQSVPWKVDANGALCYERQVNRGKGLLQFWMTDSSGSADQVSECLQGDAANAAIANLDIRAACLNLIYAAYATGLNQPWEQEFVISDRQIEHYLGLDKRKDLSKLEKLSLIRELALQPCRVVASINWPRQGRIPEFSMQQQHLWHMVAIQHHFEDDSLGCRHLVGLTFQVRAGEWTKHFLNQQGHWNHTAFYQYGSLPSCLCSEVMSSWQQHEGAMRMLLWLLFKTRMGYDQPVTVQTLMRVGYGEERIIQACAQTALHKRLLKTFESDLETLYYYGIKPVFDPETYPYEVQPLWAKLRELPDDAEDALEFWIQDGSQKQRLTDSAPRGKWKRVFNARILRFELPETWEVKQSRNTPQKRHLKHHRQANSTKKAGTPLSSEQIIAARKQLCLSQRHLADLMGKSQSWIRDVEKGRFHPSAHDQMLLRKILKMDTSLDKKAE
jgi:DNA-binding transcriptional regulator YiaG